MIESVKSTTAREMKIGSTLSSLLQQNIDFSFTIGILKALKIYVYFFWHAISIALKRNKFIWIQKHSKTITFPDFDNDTEKGALKKLLTDS